MQSSIDSASHKSLASLQLSLLNPIRFGWHYSSVMSVYLDVVPDQSFIRSLKTFVARRGLPIRFISG